MMSNTEAKQTGSTMLNQLGNISMVNGRNIVYGTEGEKNAFVQFNFSGYRKANMCKIIYNSRRDNYDLGFYKVINYKLVTIALFEDIYDDQLQDLFKHQTGLDLRL